jgi:uroporphyrinogen-III decarboxylase
MDRDTIIILTLAVRLYRRLRQIGVYEMPIDTTGLKNKAMKLRAKIDSISTIYDKADTAASTHLSDLTTLEADITNMSDDLMSAVRTMGNGSSAGVAQEPPKQPPAVQQPEPQNNAPVTPASAPAVAQTATFQPAS